MTPAQLSERKAALAKIVADAKAGVAVVLAKFQPGSQEHVALRNANVQMDSLVTRCNSLADGLLPYSDPDFYRELLPSLARDDRGEFARGKLEQAFPE